MAGRTHAQDSYRFGFNGKEMDNDINGTGNIYDYGFRIYNPSLGKFLSLDPLTHSYPWYTPYQFAGNNPIWAIDLDGLEEFIITVKYDVVKDMTEYTLTYNKDYDPKTQTNLVQFRDASGTKSAMIHYEEACKIMPKFRKEYFMKNRQGYIDYDNDKGGYDGQYHIKVYGKPIAFPGEKEEKPAIELSSTSAVKPTIMPGKTYYDTKAFANITDNPIGTSLGSGSPKPVNGGFTPEGVRYLNQFQNDLLSSISAGAKITQLDFVVNVPFHDGDTPLSRSYKSQAADYVVSNLRKSLNKVPKSIKITITINYYNADKNPPSKAQLMISSK